MLRVTKAPTEAQPGETMKSMLRVLGAVAILAAAPLHAQQNGPVETRLEARKVVRAADGQESFAPATDARPGDVIEYVATYRNRGRAAVRDLQATLPIPPDTELVPSSANPPAAKASVDSRAWGDIPLKRKVVRNGVQVEE